MPEAAPELLAHPIPVAWISAGSTGAQNYDEFATDAEIEAIIARNPDSVLGIEMPQCAPEARAAGISFSDALPGAAARLHRLEQGGQLRRAEDVVAACRITSPASTTYGLLAMVDTEQISASPDQPGRVIRNEDVFPAKVAQRCALIRTLGHLASSVLLIQSAGGPELEDRLAEVIAQCGEPQVSDTDQLGQVHDIWSLPAGPDRDALLELAGAGELIVADGNHRTLAAQEAGLDRFLAMITTPGSVHIRAYNRLVHRLGRPAETFLGQLRDAGAVVEPWVGEVGVPVLPGTVALYLPHGQAYAVRLPAVAGGNVVDRLDHSVVERLLFGEVLAIGPEEEGISYIGGDYPADWLTGEVDAGRAEAAVLISPVSVEDFVAVNLARLKMPRKSTWFTPKARAGLVLAQLTG